MNDYNIERYDEITDEMCKEYSGKTLKSLYNNNNSGYHQLMIEIIHNGKRKGIIYHPLEELYDDKIYKCFEHSNCRHWTEYNIISILNY